MRILISALVAALVMLPVAAGAAPDKTRIEDFGFPVFTCEEPVFATGTFTTSSDDQTFAVSFHGKGVGVSGAEYIVKSMQRDMIVSSENGATVITSSNTVQVIGKGQAANSTLQIRFHLTFTPNGMAHSHEQFIESCG
jgi:hypothetical protein